MKTALVTTTINVPHVLALYAKHDPGVMFFVIGDRKTPDHEVVAFLEQHCPRHAYYGIDYQHQLGYKCSRLLGENCIQRRNIGYLEALKWGADVIITIDDDNIPIEPTYFHEHRVPLEADQWHGVEAGSHTGWFDPGHLLNPPTEHRGFPHTKRAQPAFRFASATVGVSAGLCLGDPDISAVTRIATHPTVHGVSELGRGGVLVEPRTWTVFNSQNTAWRRELTPCMFLAPGIGRYDDIFASLIAQRVMRETGMQVRHGQPFVWQQRNQHDLITDLENEVFGERNIVHLAHVLDSIPAFFSAEHPVRTVYKVLQLTDWYPKAAVECALAFLDDCEKVL